jgi:hypothetical protein
MNGDRVQVDGVWFRSATLAHQLRSVERVFPHVVTCGHEMDEVSPAKEDQLKAYWWELIKEQLLEAAEVHLKGHLLRRFRLSKTGTMHPGSGDAEIWPIEQQRELFALLGDVKAATGVQLNHSFLMVPTMTTSGILFPTETDFSNCEVCHREDCLSRQAPFNPDLWEEIQDAENDLGKD